MASNGELDTSTLVDITGFGDYLTAGAAADWFALRDYVRDAFGLRLGVTEAYRDRAAQDEVWRLYLAGDPRVPYPPAPKYTSNHGWAEAVDCIGYSQIPSFDAVMSGFGWVRDVSGEGWHLHHVRQVSTAGGSTSPFPNSQQEEEDMALEKPTIVSDGGEYAVMAPWLVSAAGVPGYITAKVNTAAGTGLARKYRDPAKGSVDKYATADYLGFVEASRLIGEAYFRGLKLAEDQ